MRSLILIIMGLLTACSSLDSNASFHKRIGFFRASELAGEYLVDKNLEWGDPISTRIVENYVVFFYAPPQRNKRIKNPQEGDRVLYVDIHNGEVSPTARM